MPPPGIPVGVPLCAGIGGDRAEVVQPKGAEKVPVLKDQRYRLRNDGMLIVSCRKAGSSFFGSTDTEVAVEWIDNANRVLQRMGCSSKLWVRVDSRAVQTMNRIC